jgi:hypothetical protein
MTRNSSEKESIVRRQGSAAAVSLLAVLVLAPWLCFPTGAAGQVRPVPPPVKKTTPPEKKAPPKSPAINPADVGGPRGMGAILRGTVVDRNGAEVAQATVKAVSANDPQKHWETITDAAGRFQFQDLPVGLYTVETSRGGFQSHKHVGLKLDSLLCSIRIALSAGAPEQVVTTHFVELRGQVTGPNGDPVAEAHVEFTGGALAKSLSVLTDADGEFRVSNFQAGFYGVRVSAPGFVTDERPKVEIAAQGESKPASVRFVLRKRNQQRSRQEGSP